MLIYPSEQSEEAELDPQKAVTSLVRQGCRKKRNPFQTHLTLIDSIASSYPACSGRVGGCRTRGEPARRKIPHPHFCCQPNLTWGNDRCCSTGWALCCLSHSLLTAGTTSCTTVLRGQHLSSKEAAACTALEEKEHSFAWLLLALSMPCTASQHHRTEMA